MHAIELVVLALRTLIIYCQIFSTFETKRVRIEGTYRRTTFQEARPASLLRIERN